MLPRSLSTDLDLKGKALLTAVVSTREKLQRELKVVNSAME